MYLSLALVNIAENYPPETWTQVYTDGSATKEITDGGAGIIIQYPSGATQNASSATGKHCTNHRAETEALKQAATLVKDSLESCSPTVFTDALSVLEALQTNKSPLLSTQMQELGNTCRVVLQWIPAHCGIPGNEQADQLAKCEAQEKQPSTSIHYQEKTTIIKTALKPRQEKDAYHLLDRPGQVVWHDCVPATTGPTHRKLKIVPSPTCPCGEENQTTEHVLQICNRHQPERIALWPSATPLHQKIYGGLEDLKKTTNFITAAGLVV